MPGTMNTPMDSTSSTRRAIIYVRVSDEQQVDGTSLEFQEEECKRFCVKNGLEVVEVFREEGESAKDLSLNNRKEFLRAIEFCRKNKGTIQAFVVLRVNRFARNTEDHFAVRKILLNYSVSLLSVTEPIGNKPAEKLVETVLAATSDYENAIRRQQCTDGMCQKINQGLWPWRPPVGYKCEHFKKRGEKKTRPDPPDEQTFPLIQRALKEYANSVITSQPEMARRLDLWGLAKIRNRKTTPQLVNRLLGNHLKFYAGILRNPFTGDERRGLHVPMITEEELEQIQLRRSGKRIVVKRDRFNPLFPLRKTILCPSCKRPLTGSTPRGNGGTYPYYHCYWRECPLAHKAIKKETLEQDFSEYLRKIVPKEGFLALFKETILDLWQEQGNVFEREAQKYEKQLVLLQEKRQRIFEMREDGSYTREEFQERKDQMENEIAATKMSLSESRIEQFDTEGVLAYAISFIRDFARQWFDLPPQLRLRFQRLVFPDGIPYDREQGFGTARLGLIFELNRTFDGQESHLVDPRGIEPRTHPCHGCVMPLYYGPVPSEGIEPPSYP